MDSLEYEFPFGSLPIFKGELLVLGLGISLRKYI